MDVHEPWDSHEPHEPLSCEHPYSFYKCILIDSHLIRWESLIEMTLWFKMPVVMYNTHDSLLHDSISVFLTKGKVPIMGAHAVLPRDAVHWAILQKKKIITQSWICFGNKSKYFSALGTNFLDKKVFFIYYLVPGVFVVLENSLREHRIYFAQLLFIQVWIVWWSVGLWILLALSHCHYSSLFCICLSKVDSESSLRCLSIAERRAWHSRRQRYFWSGWVNECMPYTCVIFPRCLMYFWKSIQ